MQSGEVPPVQLLCRRLTPVRSTAAVLAHPPADLEREEAARAQRRDACPYRRSRVA
jgi:hypothetical protein